MRPRAVLHRAPEAHVVSDSGAQRTSGDAPGLRTLRDAGDVENSKGAKAQSAFATHSSAEWSFASTPVSGMLFRPRLQAKLEIGPVHDPLEHEADRVADQVMRMPDPGGIETAGPAGTRLQRKCSCGGSSASGACEECKQKEEGKLQRSPSSDPSAELAPPIVHEVLGSPGTHLDTATHAYMTPRFGYDFSDVRIHADKEAAESAKVVNARAYTVGQHIVFGRGQYAPATAEGTRLLAHELTHVVQQSNVRAATPCTTLQRTPAPPEFKSVAGVRDLARLTIDPIPDFVASSLTAARDINAHINDVNVVHLSWELYGPSDNFVSGFSTLPGNAKSTSAPFSLDPATFSGPRFQAGLHLLRCVGRNAQHQPIVYADRDFNVLSSDLTTGTAKAGAHGALTFTSYQKTDANPPATPRYNVDVALSFKPAGTIDCDDVAFIQSLESLNQEGKSQHKFTSSDQDARQTPLAWSVDRVVGAPSAFYITRLDPRTNRVVDEPGWGTKGRGKPTPSPATLIDKPSWNKETSDRFESCAICRSGSNVGQVYGCATWGYTATSAGVVTLMPRSLRDTPSDEFKEAKDAWNRWRTTKPAASRPAEAPGLR